MKSTCFILFTILALFQESAGFLVSARAYVCTETKFKLITDAWSVKDNLLFLRLNHYSNQSTKEVDQRLIVYDVSQDKFLNIFLPHDRHTLTQTETSTKLSDVISMALMKSIDEARSPSPLYFDSRTTLRTNCQMHWLYDPPNSAFCRRHGVTLFLGRILGIVNQMSLNKPDNIDYDIYRTSIFVSENFGSSTVRPVTRWSIQSIQDSLSQFISTSTLSLQINHPNLSPSDQNVRFLFSNKLGLFISWLPSNIEFASPESPNCAIMLPVKLQPIIRLCSRKYSFVSIVELDPFIYIIIPDNKVIRLPHSFLVKQFRIYNNLEIDLDSPEHRPRELFESFFHCSDNSRKLELKKLQTKPPVTTVNPENEYVEDLVNETRAHKIKKREIEEFQNSWYWNYLAPIGTYLLITNCLLLVLYIVDKKKDRDSQILENLSETKLCIDPEPCRENQQIFNKFKLSPEEVIKIKNSVHS